MKKTFLSFVILCLNHQISLRINTQKLFTCNFFLSIVCHQIFIFQLIEILLSSQNTNQTRDTNDSSPNHVENQSHSHSFQQTENTQPNFETTNEKSKETEPNISLENHELPSDQPKGQPMITRSKVRIYKPKIYLAKREQKRC